MRAWGLILLLAICTGAAAQQSKRPPKLEPLPEPPPPPAIPGGLDEERVVIPLPQGHQVEELREGGRVVALRVTPPGGGKPYFIIDTTGNGNWVRRDSLDDGNRVPMWPLYNFD